VTTRVPDARPLIRPSAPFSPGAGVLKLRFWSGEATIGDSLGLASCPLYVSRRAVYSASLSPLDRLQMSAMIVSTTSCPTW
jgi:hypothetical protein